MIEFIERYRQKREPDNNPSYVFYILSGICLLALIAVVRFSFIQSYKDDSTTEFHSSSRRLANYGGSQIINTLCTNPVVRKMAALAAVILGAIGLVNCCNTGKCSRRNDRKRDRKSSSWKHLRPDPPFNSGKNDGITSGSSSIIKPDGMKKGDSLLDPPVANETPLSIAASTVDLSATHQPREATNPKSGSMPPVSNGEQDTPVLAAKPVVTTSLASTVSSDSSPSSPVKVQNLTTEQSVDPDWLDPIDKKWILDLGIPHKFWDCSVRDCPDVATKELHECRQCTENVLAFGEYDWIKEVHMKVLKLEWRKVLEMIKSVESHPAWVNHVAEASKIKISKEESEDNWDYDENQSTCPSCPKTYKENDSSSGYGSCIDG